jgi:hypothetical protein
MPFPLPLMVTLLKDALTLPDEPLIRTPVAPPVMLTFFIAKFVLAAGSRSMPACLKP